MNCFAIDVVCSSRGIVFRTRHLIRVLNCIWSKNFELHFMLTYLVTCEHKQIFSEYFSIFTSVYSFAIAYYFPDCYCKSVSFKQPLILVSQLITYYYWLVIVFNKRCITTKKKITLTKFITFEIQTHTM